MSAFSLLNIDFEARLGASGEVHVKVPTSAGVSIGAELRNCSLVFELSCMLAYKATANIQFAKFLGKKIRMNILKLLFHFNSIDVLSKTFRVSVLPPVLLIRCIAVTRGYI